MHVHVSMPKRKCAGARAEEREQHSRSSRQAELSGEIYQSIVPPMYDLLFTFFIHEMCEIGLCDIHGEPLLPWNVRLNINRAGTEEDDIYDDIHFAMRLWGEKQGIAVVDPKNNWDEAKKAVAKSRKVVLNAHWFFKAEDLPATDSIFVVPSEGAANIFGGDRGGKMRYEQFQWDVPKVARAIFNFVDHKNMCFTNLSSDSERTQPKSVLKFIDTMRLPLCHFLSKSPRLHSLCDAPGVTFQLGDLVGHIAQMLYKPLQLQCVSMRGLAMDSWCTELRSAVNLYQLHQRMDFDEMSQSQIQEKVHKHLQSKGFIIEAHEQCQQECSKKLKELYECDGRVVADLVTHVNTICKSLEEFAEQRDFRKGILLIAKALHFLKQAMDHPEMVEVTVKAR